MRAAGGSPFRYCHGRAVALTPRAMTRQPQLDEHHGPGRQFASALMTTRKFTFHFVPANSSRLLPRLRWRYPDQLDIQRSFFALHGFIFHFNSHN
jgi:hypothetical protein